MQTWQEGNYEATTKNATVYEKDGKLILGISFDVSGNEMKAYFVLVTADGAVNTKTIDRLKEWAEGWDGTDPYWFLEATKEGIAVSVTIKNEPGFKDPTKVFPKIQWVNALNKASASSMPEASDRSKIMSKFGSKLRAVAGPQPTKPVAKTAEKPADQPTIAPTAPKAPARPAPAKKQAHASLEECWELCQKAFPGMAEDALTEKWYAFVDATGMDQATMTPEGWDKVKSAILAINEECPL